MRLARKKEKGCKSVKSLNHVVIVNDNDFYVKDFRVA